MRQMFAKSQIDGADDRLHGSAMHSPSDLRDVLADSDKHRQQIHTDCSHLDCQPRAMIHLCAVRARDCTCRTSTGIKHRFLGRINEGWTANGMASYVYSSIADSQANVQDIGLTLQLLRKNIAGSPKGLQEQIKLN